MCISVMTGVANFVPVAEARLGGSKWEFKKIIICSLMCLWRRLVHEPDQQRGRKICSAGQDGDWYYFRWVAQQ